MYMFYPVIVYKNRIMLKKLSFKIKIISVINIQMLLEFLSKIKHFFI